MWGEALRRRSPAVRELANCQCDGSIGRGGGQALALETALQALDDAPQRQVV